jgi:hypothetical protein
MTPRTVALEVGAVAALWVLLFQLNSWLFARWETSALANWIFLPAALRLVAVLILGWRGAAGLFLGALITSALMNAPWPENVVLPALSALGPVLAVKLARDHLRWSVDLQGLRYSHHAYLALSAPDLDWGSVFLTMVSGDLVGTFVVMVIASAILRRLSLPR